MGAFPLKHGASPCHCAGDFPTVRRTSARNSCSVNGFSRKPSAPLRIISSRTCESFIAVTKANGTRGYCCFTCLRSVNPSMSGSSKFESTRSILVPAANNSIAALPSAASRQSNPALNSHGTIMSRIGCSSSTRRTRGRSGFGRVLATVPVPVLIELNRSPEMGAGAVFAGISLIIVKLGMRSKCLRLFVMRVMECRIAQAAIQRSLAATTRPVGSDARTLP